MTAQRLDGTATLRTIKAELAVRVEALHAVGVRPGLGTVLVGDDPGSHWYVGAKHRDCAEIGIESIRVDLPASATQAEVESDIDRLNADPACTGFLVQQPTGLDEYGAAVPGRPRQGRRRPAPGQPRRLVLGRARPAALHAGGRRRAAAPPRRAARRRRGRRRRPRDHVGRPLGLLLTRRSENATVTLCHTGTRDLAAHLARADIVVAAAGVPGSSPAPRSSRARRCSTSGRRRVDGRIAGDVGRRRRRGRRLGLPEPGRGRADDPRHAAAQRCAIAESEAGLGVPEQAGRWRPRRDLPRPRARPGAATRGRRSAATPRPWAGPCTCSCWSPSGSGWSSPPGGLAPGGARVSAALAARPAARRCCPPAARDARGAAPARST